MYGSNYKAVVSLNLPMQLLGKIDELTTRRGMKNRSDVIRQLLDVGIFIEGKMGLVETWTSQDMETIREQIETGQLVDWVAHLYLKKFENIMHNFDDERKARGMKQKLSK